MPEVDQELSDVQITQEVLAGNSGAFRGIVDRYSPRLCSFCRARLPESEVDDAMQEVFLKVFRSLRTFDAKRNFSTWFFAVAHSSVATKKLRFMIDTQRVRRAIAYFSDAHAENEGQRNLEAEMVRDLVSRLGKANRLVIELYYFAELDIASVAEILGLGESAVKTRLFRARREMAELLEKG